jgi:hypothetical protein
VVDTRDKCFSAEILAGEIVACGICKPSSHVVCSICIVLSNLGNGITVVDHAVDDRNIESGD